MTTTPGVWTILNGELRTSIASGMPCGIQRSEGLPLPSDSARCLYRDAAHGWNGGSPKSAAIFCRYRPLVALQMPDRSGLPSGVVGAGAVRSALPSAVRGALGSRRFTHCANAAQLIHKIIVATTR